MKFDKKGMLIPQKINYEIKNDELGILTTSFEKSEVIKIKNDNKEIRAVLINSFELKEEKLSQIDDEIKQLRKELNLESD